MACSDFATLQPPPPSPSPPRPVYREVYIEPRPVYREVYIEQEPVYVERSYHYDQPRYEHHHRRGCGHDDAWKWIGGSILVGAILHEVAH